MPTKKTETKKAPKKIAKKPVAKVKVKKTEPKKEAEIKIKKKRVRHSYLYAVGRRKTAVARTRLYKSGSGKITVNEKAYTQYFPLESMRLQVMKPLEAVGIAKEVDISIKVAGGGLQGQAIACQHGIARVLLVLDKEHRSILKPEGFLRRDSRRKERKKPGLKKARRAPQWAKR